MQEAEKILASITFPPRPEIVFQIQEETKKARPNIPQIVVLLEKDPSMVARMIKLINSPLYGLRNKVTSISHALSLLGLETFGKFVVTSALQEILKKQSANDPRLLDHALATAIAAEKVVECLERQGESGVNRDAAYLAGLFHDGGMTLILMKYPNYGPMIDLNLGQFPNMLAKEQEGFGTNHCAMGSLLAKSWYLPREVTDAILFHHAPDFPELMDHLPGIKLTAVIELADYLASKYAYISGAVKTYNQALWQVADWDQAYENVLFEIGLGQDDVQELEEQVHDLLSTSLNA